MSNRARVILCSGSRAGLATRLAEATEVACTQPSVRLSLSGEPHDALTRAAVQGVGALLADADPLPTEAWSRLPGLPELSLLLRISDAASEGGTVIVDAGSLESAVRLVSMPSRALRLLDALLTPGLAMQRPQGTAGPFEALSEIRAAVARAARLLRRTDTVVRLAVDVHAESVPDLLSTDTALGAQGVGVDGIVVMRRPGERAAAADQVARLLALGPAVWSTGRRCRPVPPGRQATDVLTRPRGLRAEELEVIADGVLLVAVVPCDAERVGLDGEELVVEVAGTMRWIPLPAALTRCTVVSARRLRGTVEVAFRPDDARWRPAS